MKITKNGKRLPSFKFTWDKKLHVITTEENNIEIILEKGSATIKAGDSSTIDAGGSSTIDAGDSSTIKAGSYSIIKAGWFSTIDTGSYSIIKAGRYSTIDAGGSSTIDAGDSSTIKAGSSSTIDAGSSSTIDAGSYSIIKAGDSSTIDAGGSSTIDADNSSTIDACWYSIIKAGWSSTIKANGKNIVAIRHDIFECIVLNNQTIQWCPYKIPGYLELIDGKWYKDGEEHIIADSILSKVITTKGNVRKVRNFNVDTKEYDSPSYLIEQDGQFAHGATIKEAKEDLAYKLLDRDMSGYENYTLDTTLPLDKMIVMYRSITGACSQGTRNFVERIDKKEEYSIKEIIKITENQYGGQTFKEFFTKHKEK